MQTVGPKFAQPPNAQVNPQLIGKASHLSKTAKCNTENQYIRKAN